MKKNILISTFLMLSLTFGITFYSCENIDADSDTAIASDNALAEGVFNDVGTISDQASEGQLATFIPNRDETILSACATVTLDNTSSPKKITVDFGSANCLCSDGRNRRGIILITYTGGYRDSGIVISISFTNYFVNDHQVKGTKTITNKGKNSLRNLNYDIDVNGTIIKPSGDSITWISTRNNEWIAGSGTPIWTDDVYLITGNGSGVSAAGLGYTVNITTALRKEIGFKYLVSGVIDVKPTGKLTRTIDYGNGTRDNIATITIRNKSTTIYMN